jgi:predicted neuraminidase
MNTTQAKSVLQTAIIIFAAFAAARMCAAQTPPEAVPFFSSEAIFDFDAQRHPANHASSIAQMPNGDLLATWFGGSAEGKPDVAVWSSRKPAGKDKWTAPAPLIDEPGIAEGNSLLFTGPKGTVYLFFVRKYAEWWAAWDKAKIFLQTSDDSGFSWTAPRLLLDEMGRMIRNNVVELPDGRLLLPVYLDSEPSASLIWISGDGFRTWEESAVPVSKPENLQPAVASLGGGRLLLLARYKDIPGKIWESRSDDLGKTWSKPVKTKLPNPDAGISMIRLRSGALVLVYNNSGLSRTPLTVAHSEDDGKTWPRKKNIETAQKEFSYPFLIQTADGHIHLTYTADDRRTIKHAEFNEEWLKK